MVVVTGRADGTVRVRDLVAAKPPHLGAQSAVACATLPSRQVVAVTGGDDGAVRVWEVVDGRLAEESPAGHEVGVQAVACATLPDDRVVAVTGGDDEPYGCGI